MAESMEIDEDGPMRHLLSVDSIKMMGESIGVSNLNEDAAAWLSEELEYRLKEIVQNSIKFMCHSKRSQLSCSDFDNSLKTKNIEPLYGFDSGEYIPFRHTSGGGKELFYTAEKEIDLVNLLNSPLPKLPCDVSLKAHWLAVDGVQPAISENPPLCTLDEQHEEAAALSTPSLRKNEPVSHFKDIKFSKKEAVVSSEWSSLKPLQAHSLSLEQQLYYKEITEACVGLSAEHKTQEALGSLATDPGLYQLLPQFTSFINEGIKVNLTKRRLNPLKYLLKMISSLLENPTLSMEKYLHELVPSVLTCLVNRQLCPRPEAEDHWSLRDLAAKILARVCKKYNNSVNNLQTRLTRVLAQALRNNTQGLAVHYGAIMGIVELGTEAVTTLVLPRLKAEGELIRAAQVNSSSVVEQVAAGRLQSMIQRQCSPILLSVRPSTDTLQDYQTNFGQLGQVLFNQVKTLRQNKLNLSSKSGSRPVSLSVTSPHLVTASKSITSPQLVPKSLTSPNLVPKSASKPGSPAVTTLSSPGPRMISPVTTSSTISASILSAVMSNPNAQAVLSALASKAKTPTTPKTVSPPKTPTPTTSSSS